MIRSCVICGNEFDALGSAKVCSDPCRRKRTAAQTLAWYAANSEKARTMAENVKQRRKDQRRTRGLKKSGPAKVAKVKSIHMRACVICGTQFETRGTSKSCSDPCRREQIAVKNAAHNARAQKLKPIRTCIICGGDLPKGKRKMCSPKCEHEQNKQRLRDWHRNRKADPDEPPVDEFGDYLFIMTPRRARLLKLFEAFNPWHFDSPV
jgi:predicted nucleic acid-binding Zn ribbon protein